MPNSKRRGLVINLDHCGYGIVHRRATHYGWHIAEKGETFDIIFSHHHKCFKMIDRMIANPRLLQPVQRINHLFNNKCLYNKGLLGKNLNDIATLLPSVFDFHPRTFKLPADLHALNEWHSSRSAEGQPCTYIIKPCANMQGKGIRLSQDPAVDAEKRESCVVQDYIADPLLLDGFKFDLRLYVLVLCVDPLVIYVYNDGLARLCTTTYVAPTSANISKTKMHLTNFAINKKSKKFDKSSAEDEGSKRSIAAVMEWLESEGVDTDLIWARIVDLMSKTIIMAHPKLRRAHKQKMAQLQPLAGGAQSLCYEIYGFDVMLDNLLKPWIIEINHAPCFGGGTKLDTRIKVGVIGGAFRRLGVTEARKAALVENVRKHWQDHTMQQAKDKAAAIKALKASKAPRVLPRAPSRASAASKVSKQSPARCASSLSAPCSPVLAAAAADERPQTSATGGGSAFNVTDELQSEHACTEVVSDEESPLEDEGAAAEESDGDDCAADGNLRTEAARAVLPWLERKVGYSLAFDQKNEAHYAHYRHIFEAANSLLEEKGDNATAGDDY